MKKLNILVTCHEFSPRLGSECSAGWNIIQRLSEYHNITLIYAQTNQFKTQNYKEHVINDIRYKNSNIKYIAIPQPKKTLFFSRINKMISSIYSASGSPLLYFIGVKYWEKSIYNYVIKNINLNEFDIIHHFNHISFREPGYLWRIKDKCFVWGPTSGTSNIPLSFIFTMSLSEIFKNIVRNFSNFYFKNCSSKVHQASIQSSIIYTVSKQDFNYFKKKCNNVKMMLDVGGYNFKKVTTKSNNIRFLWVGRLDNLKALDILLIALSRLGKSYKNYSLKIIGDGPKRKSFESMSKKFDLNSNITWMGNLSKEEVLKNFKNSDFLIFTSIKEAASAVVLESLSCGIPVLCHDAFGMSYAIDDKSGIKVEYKSKEKSIKEFKNKISEILIGKVNIDKLKKGAFKRSEELSWDSISKKISKDYFDLLKSN